MTVEEGVAQEAVAWLYEVDGWSHKEVRMNPKRPLPDGWTETVLAPQAPFIARIAELEAALKCIANYRGGTAFTTMHGMRGIAEDVLATHTQEVEKP